MALIYVAELGDVVKGQVVFPDLLVNEERYGQLRSAMIDKFCGKGMGIDRKLMELHSGNNVGCVVKPLDKLNGVEMPLCATTRLPAKTPEAPLNPLAMASIRDGVVSPAPQLSAEERWRWVHSGLKRRDQSNPTYRQMTEWVAPRQYRKGGGGEGSSGKSSGGSGSTTGSSGKAKDTGKY